jgi:APA family basic amino acid/polyamine antiporter
VENFIYGVTLAMSSFIGIESIAQAAEETRNPWKHLPSSFKYSIIAVIFFTLSFSVLGIGVLGWRGLADSIYNPVAQIASRVPLIGHHFALIVAFVAFLITLVSTNTGVIGVSRVTYSMAKFNLIPRVFSRLHRKRAVPYISIVFFGIIGGALALTGNLEMVAGLYNFGALLSYMLVNYSHIKLRVVDADAYRPWKTPLNVRIGDYEISLLALIGLVSTASLFFLVVVYHPMGRFLGGIWVVVGLVSFIVYHKIYLRRKVVEEIKLKPIIYKIRTAVIVPLYVDSDTLYKSIYYNFEDIHDLRLISLVEFPRVFRRPLTVSWREVLSIKHDIERRLDEVCSRLREKGFMCSKFVVVGTKESLVHHIVNINPDTIVILTNRKPRRKGLEHPLAKSLKGDYRIVYLFKA